MQRVGELLRSFLAGKLTDADEQIVELVAACGEILGDAGRHTSVRDLRGRTLVLTVDHPGWAQLLSMRKADILRRLAERLPGVSIDELRVVVGVDATVRPAPRRVRPAQSTLPGPDVMASALSTVRDEGLRRSLRALYEQAAQSSEDSEGDRIDTGDTPGV